MAQEKTYKSIPSPAAEQTYESTPSLVAEQTYESIPSPTAQQSARQDEQRALQEDKLNEQKVVQQGVQPHYPDWPTSKPGPRSTPPPPGMRSINALRSEQVKEVGYNQETGEPGVASPLRSMPDQSMTGPTSFDQQETAQDALRRGKHRL